MTYRNSRNESVLDQSDNGFLVTERKMKWTFLIIAWVALATPASAQSVAERSGINRLLGLAPAIQDFVTLAAIGEMYKLEASKLAQEKGSDSSKNFAEHMIEDHTKTSTELKVMVSNRSVQVEAPTALDSSHQKKIEKLNGMAGREFDREYLSQQVSVHKAAVSLFTRYSRDGSHPDLKRWAARTLPMLQEHLRMAQDLEKRG
jgi:putative membrane protein